jgi:hypothetical protein
MPCALAKQPSAFIQPTFLAGGTLVTWGQFDMSTGGVNGAQTTLPGCTTKFFSTDLFDMTPVGDQGVVFLDTLNPDLNINEATLRYSKVASGVLPAPGTVIQARAGLQYATLLPSLPAVLYVISASAPGADGLYLNSTLPFTVTAPVGDGGAGDTSGGNDAGVTDAGTTEAGGGSDAAGGTGGGDAGASDAGASDVGATDAGVSDAGASDSLPSG